MRKKLTEERLLEDGCAAPESDFGRAAHPEFAATPMPRPDCFQFWQRAV
jgi:hypothetical protein